MIIIPKRFNHLFEQIISDENLSIAIDEVNRTHRWHKYHIPNKCTAWVQLTKSERIIELRNILINGFIPSKPRISERYDMCAQKWRTITEPKQYPDQYIHHALIQVLQPIFMRHMDEYCCGSIQGRGTHKGKRAIEKWIRTDKKGTKYELYIDIYHFYDSIVPNIVMDRMRHLIKDGQTLTLIENIIKDGISIGAYTSQWFANTFLQPLDKLIRNSGYAKYYVRYMDNLTIFGSNKRNLRKLKVLIEQWLHAHSLKLKSDWQIFDTSKRIPDAMGFRYGKTYTIPRKYNLLRLKRYIKRYRKRRDAGKSISVQMVSSIMSRLGQLKHCNNNNIYNRLFQGEKIMCEFRKILRRDTLNTKLTWDSFLEYFTEKKLTIERGESMDSSTINIIVSASVFK